MTEAWHHVEDAMASVDQGVLSLAALALGSLLAARGFALMKPSFVAGIHEWCCGGHRWRWAIDLGKCILRYLKYF